MIKLDVPSNVSQKKRVASILVFKIWPSQEILKIRDGTPLEAEGILTYIKSPRNRSVWHFYSKLDVPSNVLQKKKVARILVFKIWPSQEILKIRDGTPLEAEGILTYIKSPRNGSIKALEMDPFDTFLSGMDSGFQNLAIKIRDGTPLEADGILTYIKSPRNRSVWHFSSKLDVPSNVVHKKRVAWILVFKIWPSQEILKIRDGTPLKKKRVAWILVFKIWPSQEILKIRDGTPLEAEGILTYIKSPRNRSVWHFYSKLDVPSNVLQKKKVARILVFKIWPSQEILKIRDGTPLEAEGILTYIKSPRNGSSGMDSCFQNLAIKIRDGTPLEADGILTYIKSPRNRSVWHFSSKLDVPSNVVHKKRVARILVFKIWPSKFVMADGILTYIKSPRNRSVWHFSSKLDVPSNVVHKKRVAWILVFKIWPSQEILKIRDGTPLKNVPSNVSQKKRVASILVFKIWPSQEILKIRDGTPLEAEGILTYIKSPRNRSVWHFYSKLDVPSNVLQKKKVARILVFKIWPSQEILKIRDGTPLEAEGILTYIKSPRNGSKFSKFVMVPLGGGRNFNIQIKALEMDPFDTFL
ncbi:hypothetical protein OROMI_004613 [Orobanche minor]